VGTFWFWNQTHHRHLFSAVSLYYLAENMWQVLLLWRVLTLTHSALWMGAAVGAYTLATLAVGIAGPHRGGGRRISTLAAAQAVLMAAGLSLSLRSAPALIGLAVINGWFQARIVPSLQALLMRTSPPDQLSRYSAAYELTSRTGMLLGPVIAGAMLAAFPNIWPFSAIIALFAAVAVLLHPLEGDHLVASHLAAATHASGFMDALRIVRQDSFLSLALIIRGLNNFLWPAFILAIPLMSLHVWHTGSFGYGAIRSVWGFSTVLGTIWLVPRLTRHLQRSYFLSWLLTGTGFLFLALSRHFAEALTVALIGALGSPVVHIALDTHIGRHVSAALQGRLFALQQFIMSALSLLGLAVISPLLNHGNPRIVLGSSGLVMMAAAIAGLLLWRRLPSSQKHPMRNATPNPSPLVKNRET
jgi:MFS family permease